VRRVGCPGKGGLDGSPSDERRLRLVQHVEAGIDAGLRWMGAQDLPAEAVDCADARCVQVGVDGLPGAALLGGEVASLQIPPHLGTDPIAHLAGRLAREGDGNDAAQGTALCQEREIARHEGARLSRTGARGDDNVAPPGGDGGTLLLVGGELGHDGVERFGHGR